MATARGRAGADERGGRTDVLEAAVPMRAIRPAQVDAPRRAEDHASGFGLREALVDRAVAAHLSGRQVAQTDAMPRGDVLGDRPAETDFEVVGVRTEDEQINGIHDRQRAVAGSEPTTWPMNSLNAFCRIQRTTTTRSFSQSM